MLLTTLELKFLSMFSDVMKWAVYDAEHQKGKKLHVNLDEDIFSTHN